MIQAKKAVVVTGFHKQTLEVRKMELDYHLMVFDRFSSTASLLAGFASSVLSVDIWSKREDPYLVILFLLCTSSALGANLLVVIVTAVCGMWGPGLALRGEDATAVDNAIHILDLMSQSVERFFLFGLVCYFVSAILVIWVLFKQKDAIIVSGIFGVLLVFMLCKSHKIRQHLMLNKVASSKVQNHKITDMGKLMASDSKLSVDRAGGVNVAFASRI